MRSVSRSVYQKLAEENKRLKRDIKTLVWVQSTEDRDAVFRKWYKRFKEEHEFKVGMKDIVRALLSDGKEGRG